MTDVNHPPAKIVDLPPLEFVGDLKVLFSAFLKAQMGMGELLKTSTNPAFKSKYADLGAVIETVLPALNSNGFALMQPPHSDGALVEVETLLLHESGGYIRSSLGLRPMKQDPQGIGSAVTYGRRYSLQAITGVAPEDDDGNAASAKAPPKPAQAPQAAPTLTQRADRLEATLKAVTTEADLRKAYSLASSLRAELDAKDPDRLAVVNSLYEDRLNDLTTQVAA